MSTQLTNPAEFVRVEAAALARLAERMESDLRPAVDHALAMMASRTAEGKRIAVTGVGKSGIIAHKIAAHVEFYRDFRLLFTTLRMRCMETWGCSLWVTW